MPAVRPRDAATVLLTRVTLAGERTILMGRRSRRAAFAPDVFVFPGGRAEQEDDRLDIVAPLRADVAARLAAAGAGGPKMARRLASAAVRETWEETGYALGDSKVIGEVIRPDHSPLTFVARAITPTESPIRFHARFFHADGSGLEGEPGGSGELTDLAWYPLEAARKLPAFDITEFILAEIDALTADAARMPLFAYRGGRPAIRWYGHP